MVNIFVVFVLIGVIVASITLGIRHIIRQRVQDQISDRLQVELSKTLARENSEIKNLGDADKTPTAKEIQDALRNLRDRGHLGS